MSYRISIVRSAEKEFLRLPGHIQTRARSKMLALELDPRPTGCKKLSGSDRHRIRIGDYRVVYNIDDPQKHIAILSIGHRREIYR